MSLPHGPIHLAPGYRLTWEGPGQSPMLANIGARIPLSPLQATVLELCNGSLAKEDLVKTVEQRHPGVAAAEVWDFLQVAHQNNWIHGNNVF